jgi:dTDP-4-dehydrorhamnose reductase
MIVVVTGARGLLGSEIIHSFGPDHEVIGWSAGQHEGYRQVDVTDQRQIEHGLDQDRPDLVIHCAANPNIASCEADPQAARELNALAVKKLATAASDRDVRLVHISTDYVFSGDKHDGYTEDDPPSPLQVYGHTKAEAEAYCLDAPDTLIVRLPLLFGIGRALPRTTFPEQVVRALRAGTEVAADAVEVRQPTLTADVARVLHDLIEARATGIVHVAAPETATKHQWAGDIATITGLDPSLIRATQPLADSHRPMRSTLLNSRLAELQIPPPRTLGPATRAFLDDAELH